MTVGEKLTAAPVPPVASTVRFGAVIAGGVVSLTVTVKVAVEWLPTPSLAVTVTVVVPNPNVEPEAIE